MKNEKAYAPVTPLAPDVDVPDVMLNWLLWANIPSLVRETDKKLTRKAEPVGNPPLGGVTVTESALPSTSVSKTCGAKPPFYK